MSVTSSEWTCDDCARASTGLAIFSVNDEALQAMADVIIAEVCPTVEDPDFCIEAIPLYWAAVAKVVFPEHWKHICDDLEECQPPTKVYFIYSFLHHFSFLRLLHPTARNVTPE